MLAVLEGENMEYTENLNELSIKDQEAWEILKSNVWSIESIQSPTDNMCLYAVERAWNALKYIKEPSPRVVKKAIESKGWAIQYINDPPEELQILAVKKDWDSIQFIKTPTHEVMVEAVKGNWRAIQYVDNPPLDIIRKAVQEDEEAARYLDDINEENAAILIGDNVKVVKYIGQKISDEMVEKVLQSILSKEDVDPKYVVDFIECDALKINKVKFIRDYGSRKAKAILVDYKLRF